VWDARELFGKLRVWFPPPELAQQAITFMLEAWVEQPLTMLAIFFVPWVIPAFWHGLSQYIHELPLLCLTDPWLPLRYPPRLPIPVLVYIWCLTFVHCPCLVLVGWSHLPMQMRFTCSHVQQTEYLCRLSPRSID
jgi:hypothetical protein